MALIWNRLWHWAVTVLAAVVIQAPITLLLARFLGGLDVDGFGGAVALALAVEIIFALTYWLALRIAFRFSAVIFLVVTFAAAVISLRIALLIVDWLGFDIHIDGLVTMLIVIGAILVAQAFASALYSSIDDFVYYLSIRSGLRYRHRDDRVKSTEPGVMFLEIDGLAKPILEEALAAGRMPFLKSWMDDDGYVISPWEPDLSSQTSASQAGILLGSNEDIPAFRWWDKQTSRPIVSSSSAVATMLESRLSTGNGLLVGGASRWNVFTGDATDALATFSTARGSGLQPTIDAALFLSNPVSLSRTTGMFIAEIFRERWQAWQQNRNDVQPRLHRTMKYALVRGATNATMQEMSIFMLTSDILQGIPVVYNSFFSYDEVAHHSGPRTSDAMKVLTKLDAGFNQLRRAVSQAPRPYHLVVLSDHGQSAGATFLQRYGHSLEDVVRSATISRQVETFEGQSESMGNATAAVDAVVQSSGWVGEQVGKRTSSGRPEFTGSTERRQEKVPAMPESANHDIVVMASGNHGLIYFTGIPERVVLEDLEQKAPNLLPTLVSHPGVSFVMVHARDGDEAVVIGPAGRRWLKADRLEGDDPLAKFTATSRNHLLRTDGFSNAPDLLVMSMYDPATGETAAFEELIGNHGGLGGPQQEPFVFHPGSLSFPADPVVGAAAVHKVLKSWVPEDATNRSQ